MFEGGQSAKIFDPTSHDLHGKYLEVRGDLSIIWMVNAAAMFIITVVTIVGNAAVILAIRRASPRFPAHYPLASLAAADFMLGLFVLPLSTARELFLFRPYIPICAFWSTMDVLCCTASILSLCTLGWERWCGITEPLARAKRAGRARLFAALIWPVAAAVALPTVFVPTHGHHLPNEIYKACSVNTNIGYVFYSVTFSFYLPAFGMMFIYTKILIALASVPKLRTHRGRSPAPPAMNADKPSILSPSLVQNCTPRSRQPKDTKSVTTENNNFYTPRTLQLHLGPPKPQNVTPSPLKHAETSMHIIPRQRRATQTIITLMSVFLLCWWPFFVMLPIDSLCECVSDNVWLVCTWLGYANSALDPLVYAVGSPTVRQALRSTLTLTYSTRSNEIPLTPLVKRRLHL